MAAGILLVVGTVLVVLLAAVVVGALLPGLSWLSVAGAIVSGFAGWLLLLLLVCSGVSVALTLRDHSGWRIAVTAVALLALAGSTVITGRLVAAGQANGVTINPFVGTPSSLPPDELVQYGEQDGEALQVAIWKPKSPRTSGAPVAFFIHGGGWVQGSAADDVDGLKTKMADEGWLVVSVGYTLATPAHHTWDIVEAQVGCALAWTQANAASYGGDASTLVSLGESAGGNLTLNTSYRANAGKLTCADAGPMPTVGAVVALYPGVNPYALYDDRVLGGGEPGRTFMEQYIGGSPTELPRAYTAVSSATHLEPGSPPTLIFQGEHDHLVQAHAVYEFVDQATSAGVDVTLVRVPYGEHVFDFTPIGWQLTQKRTLSWLAERGFTGR